MHYLTDPENCGGVVISSRHLWCNMHLFTFSGVPNLIQLTLDQSLKSKMNAMGSNISAVFVYFIYLVTNAYPDCTYSSLMSPVTAKLRLYFLFECSENETIFDVELLSFLAKHFVSEEKK